MTLAAALGVAPDPAGGHTLGATLAQHRHDCPHHCGPLGAELGARVWSANSRAADPDSLLRARTLIVINVPSPRSLLGSVLFVLLRLRMINRCARSVGIRVRLRDGDDHGHAVRILRVPQASRPGICSTLAGHSQQQGS